MKIKYISLFFSIVSLNLFSAPGDISQVPLGMQNVIPANLMFLQDSSGSMSFDLIQKQCTSNYECKRVYKCGTSLRRCQTPLSQIYKDDMVSSSSYKYGFQSDFKLGGTSDGKRYYEWGEREYYDCRALATPQPRECVSSRKYMVQREAKKLMDKIDGFYVGLMRFHNYRNNYYDGAILKKQLTLIDSDRDDYVQRKLELKEKIDSIPASGGTPLSESLSAVGTYFGYQTPSNPIVTKSTSFVMTKDFEDPTYDPKTDYKITPKNTPSQRGLSDIFNSYLYRSEDGSPLYNSRGRKESDKNKNMAIKGWCQKNFLIALTDGAPSVDDDVLSFTKSYEKIGADYYNSYLANVAGALWDIDLRPDLCDPLFLEELNEDYAVGMSSCADLLTTEPSGYSKSIYEILEEKYSRSSDDNLVTNDSTLHRYKNNIRSYIIGFAQFDSASDSETKAVSLMEKAARVGAGKYFGAKNGKELESVFDEILGLIDVYEASSSGIGLSQIPGGSGFLYQSTFDSSDWTGQLEKYPLVYQIKYIELEEKDREWSTDDEGTFPEDHRDRVVFSYNPDAQIPAPFRWNSLSDSNPIKADLAIDEEGNTDSLGEKRLNYLRGDQTNEFQNNAVVGFRDRAGILGDIVGSTPKFVGATDGDEILERNIQPHPNLISRWNRSVEEYTSGEQYISPKRQNEIVYVNANDGMLHAFDNEDGKEIFAYMPSYIASSEHEEGLHFLASKKYEHRFYNDGSVWVKEDVFLDSIREWRTLLISTSAAGAKGISLLDITDVHNDDINESDAENIVLWEFTHDELGYTFPEPEIGLLRNGMWGVIIGNGYDSQSGMASVFILNVEPNLSDGWTEGEDYFILKTHVGQKDDSRGYGKNGMSTVVAADVYQDPENCIPERQGLHHVIADPCVTVKAADVNPDNQTDWDSYLNHFYPGYGTIDRLYGGDLYGNLWAFNLISSEPDEWEVDFEGQPLFKVPVDSKGNPQPITAAPRLSWGGPHIQRCDGRAVAYLDLYRDIKQLSLEKVVVGGEFGDQSVRPYADWNFTGITIPSDNDTGDEVEAEDSEMFLRQLSCGPNVLVSFGTGQFLTADDVLDETQRSFYMVWDNYKTDDYPLTISNLDERVFTTTEIDNRLVKTITDVDGMADGEFPYTQFHMENEFGWYVDFDQVGERSISSAFYYQPTNEIIFSSIKPEQELCGAGGTSILHRLDVLSGLATLDYRVPSEVVDDRVVGKEIPGGLIFKPPGPLPPPPTGEGYQFAAVSLPKGYEPFVLTEGDKKQRGIVSWYELEQ